jgi:hypothetical protein
MKVVLKAEQTVDSLAVKTAVGRAEMKAEH